MDEKIKKTLNTMFVNFFGDVYTSKPELQIVEDTNYYYVTNKDSNIICLLPLDYSFNTGTSL